MAGRCAVCREPEGEPALLSRCFSCGADYHLNPYSDRPGKDCGDAILGESLGVEYYCAPCLEELGAEAPQSGVTAMFQAMNGGTAPPSASPAPARRRRFRRIDP